MRISEIQIRWNNFLHLYCENLEFFNLFFGGPGSGKSRIAQSIVPFMSANHLVHNGMVNLKVESPPHEIFGNFPDFLGRFSLLSPDTISQTPSLFPEVREILRAVYPVPVSFLMNISSFLSEGEKRLTQEKEFSGESSISEERARVSELRKKKKMLWQEIAEGKRRLISLLSSLSALQREIPHSLHQLKNLEQFPLSIYQSLRSFYAMEKDLKDRRQEIECKRNEIKLRAEHTQRNFEEISFPESFQQILEEIWGLLQELFQVEERVNKKRNEKEMWEKERQYIERKFQEIHEVLNMDVEKWFSILNQMQKNMQAIESQKEECIGKIERLTKQTEQHSRPPTMILHLAVISLICCILLALDIFFWKMLFLVFSLFFWKGVLLALSLLCISLFIWYFYGENQRRKLIKHIQEEIKKEMERKSSLEESLGRVNLEFAQYQWKEKTGKVRLILGLENIQTGEGAKNGIEKEREDILQKMREMEKKKEKISEMLSRLAEEEKREMEAEEELVREISGLLPAHHPFPENHSFPFLMNWWKNLSREYEEWLRYKQLSDEGERLSMALEGVARHISQLLAESGFSSWEEFEAGEREYRRYQKLKEVLQQNQKVLARLEHIAVFRWNQPLKENGGVKLETELIETSKRLQEEIDKEEKHLKELNEELSRLPEIPSMAEIEEEIGEEESRREQWKRKEGVMRKSKELLEAVHQRWEKDFPPQFLHYLHQLLRDSGWMNAQIPWSEPLLNTSLFQSFSHSERTIYSVAFRLAFLLAIPVEASIPLILDDAFAFLTQEQKEKVFAVLSGMGQRLQILYFTGRKEDLALAQKYFPSGRVFCLSSVQG